VTWLTYSIDLIHCHTFNWCSMKSVVRTEVLTTEVVQHRHQSVLLSQVGNGTWRHLNTQPQRNFTVDNVAQKNWTFSFEHNFGEYCPTLIILSLLQTRINWDQVYPKIYHHTSNLLVHNLVKWTRMCWHDFETKDVTVKQVALNVTDMDKINIVSSQAVPKMSSFSMNTHSMFSSPLVNSLSKSDCLKPCHTSMSRRFNSSTLWICLW